MSKDFSLSAKPRTDVGKGASRRLRREAGAVPAVVYGGHKDPLSITVSHKDLLKALENEAFYSHVLTLDLEGGKAESVILKDLQRHPYKPRVLHADFLRVEKGQKLHVHVPLHFINEDKCVGVRTGGGVISHQVIEVEVVCLPEKLPEFIEVDMAEVEVETVLHLTDLKLPAGVELAELLKGEGHDIPVVSIHKAKGSKASDDETAEGDAAE